MKLVLYQLKVLAKYKINNHVELPYALKRQIIY